MVDASLRWWRRKKAGGGGAEGAGGGSGQEITADCTFEVMVAVRVPQLSRLDLNMSVVPFSGLLLNSP